MHTPPMPSISAAKTLGPYTLIHQLGQGGMGVVWLAYDPALARQVAIKELRAAESTHPSLLKRLLREARAAARLNHPNTITIYQVATERSPDGDKTYIVMEYLAGGSLADHLSQHGAMTWTDAVAAIRDAVSGLAAAHEAGLVHRDIKPANLLKTHQGGGKGVVKVVDFGLVRGNSMDENGDLTVPGAFIGSPNYAAPEQAALHPGRHVDARSDIYSLGCTLYALLTGRPPFLHTDAAAVLRSQLADPWPDPRRLPTCKSLIPDSLCRILWQCSAKDPAARFPNAPALLAALETLRQTPEDSHTYEYVWPHGQNSPVRSASISVSPEDSRIPLPPISAEVEGLRKAYATAMDSGASAAGATAFRQGLAAYLRNADPWSDKRLA